MISFYLSFLLQDNAGSKHFRVLVMQEFFPPRKVGRKTHLDITPYFLCPWNHGLSRKPWGQPNALCCCLHYLTHAWLIVWLMMVLGKV